MTPTCLNPDCPVCTDAGTMVLVPLTDLLAWQDEARKANRRAKRAARLLALTPEEREARRVHKADKRRARRAARHASILTDAVA